MSNRCKPHVHVLERWCTSPFVVALTNSLRSKAIWATFFVCVSASSCTKAPAEPDPPPSENTAPPAPTVPPLQWSAPSSWTALDVPKSGPQKAGYRVPQVGNDKEEAQVEIFFFGTGAEGTPEKHFTAWFGQFDGNVGPTAKREKFSAGSMEVETVEVSGTYKIPLGPAMGKNKKAPMQMVKENFRLIGAVVKTPDRGNWFFKMAGPSDTVQAARGALRTLLESSK